MKVEREPKKGVRADKILIGKCFEHDGKVYMRCSYQSVHMAKYANEFWGKYLPVVNLVDGALTLISSVQGVIPIDIAAKEV